MTIEIFVVSPGDGREFIYSPVNRNTTISCAVSGEVLEWVVDGLHFESRIDARVLRSRRIFKSRTEESNGVTTSSVTVFGDIDDNNKTQVCCQTIIVNGELITNCTTLVMYGEHII